MLILIIAGGPDKGRIYELTDGAPIVLGREGDQVKLNDRKVSREHARLWSEGGQWYLKDLGSRHGTYRNHIELEKGQHAKLKDGDYLQIGNTVMVLGRMAANQIERSALLAGSVDQDASRRGKAPMIAAGLALAAVLGMGGYLAVQLHELRSETVPREELAKLNEQLAEMKAQSAQQTEQITQSAKQMSNSLDLTKKEIAGATETIASVRDPLVEQLTQARASANQQQLALEQIGDALAKQQSNDNSQAVLAAVTQMKTLLADQPTGDKLIARLEQAIDTNAQATGEAVQLALAEHHKTADAGALASAKQTEALMNRVLEGLASVPTREQLAEDVKLAVAAAQAKDEQFMRLVLAELRRTGDQIATDVTAAVGDDAGQAQALMKQVVAELANRPTSEQLASDLRLAMDEAFTKRDANSKELPGLMRQVLSELEQRPTSEQLAADLRRVIGEDAQRTELLVARVMSEIDQRPTAEQIASELRATDNESAAKTATLLEEVLDKVQAQDQIASQIAALRKQIETMPGTNTDAVRAVLSRLDAQERNSVAMLSAIAELRSTMPKDLPGQLDKVLAQLDQTVRTDQITDVIEKSMQRIAAAQDQQTQDAIASLSTRIDALPSAEELTKLTESQAQIAKLLDNSDARDAIGELRASLEQLSQRIGKTGDDTQLTQIIAMLKQREKSELLLAELHDAMGTQSDKTDQLKKELLASIAESKESSTSASLKELLALVRNNLLTDDSIRQAIRDEMRGTILPNQMALADARDVTTTATPGDADDNLSDDSAVNPRRLTRLESAYKQSFETGQPVTIGAGVVDPNTGEVSKGQLIDPVVAKALGFETWRDWYLTDRHAKQMRLQQEALRQRNENDAKDTGTIKLPPVIDRSSITRPEQN